MPQKFQIFIYFYIFSSFLDQYYQQFDRRVSPSIDESDILSSVRIPDDSIVVPKATLNKLAKETLAANLASPYVASVSKVPLPSEYAKSTPYNLPQEKSLEDLELERVLAGSSISPSYSTNKRTILNSGISSGYNSGYGGSSNFIDDSSFKDASYSTQQIASKYFGLATTTSQDLQVKSLKNVYCLLNNTLLYQTTNF